MNLNVQTVEERAKSPSKDTACIIHVASLATNQAQQSSSILSTRDLVLSNVDDVVNSIAQVVSSENMATDLPQDQDTTEPSSAIEPIDIDVPPQKTTVVPSVPAASQPSESTLTTTLNTTETSPIQPTTSVPDQVSEKTEDIPNTIQALIISTGVPQIDLALNVLAPATKQSTDPEVSFIHPDDTTEARVAHIQDVREMFAQNERLAAMTPESDALPPIKAPSTKALRPWENRLSY